MIKAKRKWEEGRAGGKKWGKEESEAERRERKVQSGLKKEVKE